MLIYKKKDKIKRKELPSRWNLMLKSGWSRLAYSAICKGGH